MSMTAEMRIGMSLYWVTLTPDSDGKGWTARWTQSDRPREVSSRGSRRDALIEARRLAESISVREGAVRA